MLTPQQIDNISFGRATFGGYDMQSVDELLEPLTKDYVTLYEENAQLKNKIKILVAKLEELRSTEINEQAIIDATQATCDNMVKETEEKCAKMLDDAHNAVDNVAKDAADMIAAEQAKVEEAKKAARKTISLLMRELDNCLTYMSQVKSNGIFKEEDEENPAIAQVNAVADEIVANMEATIVDMPLLDTNSFEPIVTDNP